MDGKSGRMAEKKALFEQSLRESSDELIISTLEELRESGEDYMVGPIIDLLFAQRSEVLKEAVVGFLVDIRNRAAASEIVGAIRNNRHSADVSRLVSVCWQSPLDFSDDVELFVDLLCESDYQTGLEAFSAIENALESIGDEKIGGYAEHLRGRVEKMPRETQPLARQMILVMEDLAGKGKGAGGAEPSATL